VAGIGDLLGRNGVVEQLLLWGVLNQAIGSLAQPALVALQQDSAHAHPVVALDPVTAATALSRGILAEGNARDEAARGGIDAARFATLHQLHRVRLAPADLATAVLRDYMTRGQAEAEAKPQGITADMLGVLIDLAGNAPGPDQLATALRRGLIPDKGAGRGSVSFEQGIRETRLHDKWAPILRELSRVLLSPPDAASAVVRNFLPHGDAERKAHEQGVDAADFQTLIHLSADAPGPQQLAEALRRGLIALHGRGAASTAFEQGIAEGRLADKWSPVIQGLAKLWPTPTDAIEAALKGQVTPEQGRDLYELLGGDLQFYTWLLDSQGNPPSPLEAADMAVRGIIPWQGVGPAKTSFEQAIREGRTKNKWTDAIRAMSRYVPPPGEVVTFLAHRAISQEQAHDYLAMHDMDDATLAAFMNEAELTALTDYRGLTQSAVVDMYYARMIGHDQALQLLEVLHVTDKAAELLLAYADLRQVIEQVQKSVQRIAGLFTGRKISADTARAALTGLQIPAGSIEQIMQGWQLQAQANVKTLTESQIVDAWFYLVLSEAEAMQALEAIGYTPYDAWVVLSNKVKQPLPGKPPRDVASPAGAVIPGVT
jgi:hypothetical protein